MRQVPKPGAVYRVTEEIVWKSDWITASPDEIRPRETFDLCKECYKPVSEAMPQIVEDEERKKREADRAAHERNMQRLASPWRSR